MHAFVHLITPAENTSFFCTFCMYIRFDLSLHSCILFLDLASVFPVKALQSQHILDNSTTVVGHLKKNILINLNIQTKLMYM